MPVDLLLLTFAFSAGVATFFSPCGVALIPAYVGYYAGTDESSAAPRDPRAALRAGTRFGAAAACGVLLVLVGAGMLVYVLRSQLGLTSDVLGASVQWVAVALGALLVVLGLLFLVGRGPSVGAPLRAPTGKTVLGMLGFGAVFALCSVGCTLPVFLAVLVLAAGEGPFGGFLTLAAYGVGASVLMLASAVALSLAKERAQARLRSAARFARPAGGLLLLGAGLYVLYYYLVIVP